MLSTNGGPLELKAKLLAQALNMGRERLNDEQWMATNQAWGRVNEITKLTLKGFGNSNFLLIWAPLYFQIVHSIPILSRLPF